MPDKHNAKRRQRLLTTAILVVAGAALAVGSFVLSAAVPGRPPGGLAELDRAEIAAVVGREVAGPIRAVAPLPNGTVQAYVGSGPLGGQLVRVERHKGSWRVVQRTLLY